jgi:hypothetical protein
MGIYSSIRNYVSEDGIKRATQYNGAHKYIVSQNILKYFTMLFP